MGKQEYDSEAQMELQGPIDRAEFVQRGMVSVQVWGVVLVGFVIAIAMFTNHVLGWGG